MSRSDTVLVISPHADDATIYCGGYMAIMAKQGKKIVVVRVTNDDFDGICGSEEENIAINREQSEAAYRILGAGEIIHLGYQSDYLLNVNHYDLREQFVRLIRKYRPAETLCFGLDDRMEENPDHRVTAKAFNDAAWVSGFTLHYPEHKKEGLEPHLINRRISYFRNPLEVNMPIDISSILETKISSLKVQSNVMSNFVSQIKLRSAILGIKSPLLDAPVNSIIEALVPMQAGALGEPFGLSHAELFYEEKSSLIDWIGQQGQ